MASIAAVLALAGAALLLELPALRARKHKREIAVFIVFLIVGTAMYAAMALHVKLPNPFMLIKRMYS
ncbi:hypothetical protein GXP70_06845 [Paenibacillus lycopersici]|uniref:Uncharacterized protein n=1 Tax=Paenibacillus lycopersici TaxID=2704462 RepID=A0A6C0G4C2_9BACL|nr:hypothetical protein [Paenibacillus lycopersici]QHT59695.1 hypothetical protein GXP70_06845 [Paenibacillus lycopersici]